MDFRNAHVDRVQWSVGGGKTARVKAAYGATRLEFQAPTVVADIVAVPRFPGAVDVRVAEEFPGAFSDFVDAIERGALGLSRLGTRRQWPSLQKFTVFNDAKIFDADGIIDEKLHQAPGTYKVAMMLQLDGAWVTDLSWGVKFKVTEMQIVEKICGGGGGAGDSVTILRNGLPVKRPLFLPDDSSDDSEVTGDYVFTAPERPRKRMQFLDD